MKAYFKCKTGISGDMILGALVDVGLDFDYLSSELKKLDVKFEITAEKVDKDGVAATKVNVVDKEEDPPRRGLYSVYRIIDNSSLDGKIKNKAKKIFYNLAVAESTVHGVAINKVHFHELGALDTIIDICGAVIGLEKLEVREIFCSPLRLGCGFVNTQHGRLDVPVPATKELISGLPTVQTDLESELVTPTGAAIIVTLAKEFGDFEVDAVKKGYGAGTRKLKVANCLEVNLFR